MQRIAHPSGIKKTGLELAHNSGAGYMLFIETREVEPVDD
jgi:hypothetical protein